MTDQPAGVADEAGLPPQPETVQRLRPPADPAAAAPASEVGAPPGSGDLTDELLRSDQWTDQMLQAAGIPVTHVPLVSVGGGIGSFVTVDYLRIAGVSTDRMKVLSNLDFAWQTYEYLTRVSQIPKPERIRSDSASRPDNIWGFPSYALAEAVTERTFAPLWQVLVEPIWADYYTPKAGRVFAGLERESKRIGWTEMLVKGQVRMVRKRQGGGYFIILTPMAGSTPTKREAYLAEFVHLAVGYPGLRFLPELQDFRTEHQDFHHVVSAYELHEHVYESARTKHLVVMLRGGGIVASRVLARIMDDRAKHGLSTEIVHLFRTYISSSHGPNAWNRRKGAHGFAYQGFNYPKSVWGGQLKSEMRRLEGQQRADKYKLMGGTNTPYRRRWQAQMNDGRDTGWYRTMTGNVDQMRLENGKIVSCVKTPAGRARDVTRSAGSTLSGRSSCAAPPAALASCTPRALPPLAGTSPASTRSSGSRSRPRRSPTTWRDGDSAAGSAHSARYSSGSGGHVTSSPDHEAVLTQQEARRCYPRWAVGSRPGWCCSPWSAGS